MHRAFRLRYYSRRQRDILLGITAGSATVFTSKTLDRRRPVLADSGSLENRSWTEKATALSENISTSSKGQQAADRLTSSRTGAVSKETTNTQTPPPQTKGHSTFDLEGDTPEETVSAWQDATNRVSAVSDSFTGWDFSTIRLKITQVIPSWLVTLPRYIDKLHDELSGAPWSLSWEIWEDASNAEINEEIVWDAEVRISKDLCPAEARFLQARRNHTAKALAKYLGLRESEVDPEDVPIIGLCGSGGGLRALVAGASSALCAQESGLFDCVTYTAGVSGSCWLQTLFNTSIGQRDYQRIIDHLKHRLGVHIAYPPAALQLLSSAPTNKFLLSGLVEKLRGVPDADVGLVDVYGLLLAARLLIPKDELRVDEDDLKISHQQTAVAGGEAPLPIYTAVRHEIPANLKEQRAPSQYAWHNKKHYDWFQWFEWTPYEFFCEELECGIPTWAVGRPWDAGRSVWRDNGMALPELRTPLMMGIWGSAFCATLSHYYKEIRPVVKAAGLAKLDGLLAGQSDDLSKVHPIDPAVIPNFARGLRDRLPESCPESIHKASHLQLMDAGMSNNLPIYPLLRPGRDVDIIIAFDASADVKTDNWIKVVDGYVRQRNIKGWPMGSGWPPPSNKTQQTVEELGDAQEATAGRIHDVLVDSQYLEAVGEDLGYCNVWVGNAQEKHEFMDEPPSRRVRSEDDEHHLGSPDAGITLVYFPFLANDKVPGVDPMKSDFMSTWNFVYTPEEIDQVVNLARANYREGEGQTKRTIRAVYERKKKLRLQREEEERQLQRLYRLRRLSRDDINQFGGMDFHH
jgi:cytosolic phospholipase A2